jgi:hypothetical protein
MSLSHKKSVSAVFMLNQTPTHFAAQVRCVRNQSQAVI